MSVKSVIFSVVLAAVILINGPVSAAEPTIDQVYHAAEAGNFREAQRMMDQEKRAALFQDAAPNSKGE